MKACNQKWKNILKVLSLILIIQSTCINRVSAQTEFTTWGNLTGIRVDGQLMEFETSVCIVNKDWSKINPTARERQPIRFSREGNKQIFNYVMNKLDATNRIETIAPGITTVSMEYKSLADTILGGAFFRVALPSNYYSKGTVQLDELPIINLEQKVNAKNEYIQANAKSIRINSLKRQLEITLNESTDLIIKKDPSDNVIQIYITVLPGEMKKDVLAKKSLTIKASGEIDKDEIKLAIDTSKPGRLFDGIGGNFRLQNPKTDPPVIDYCLDNLRVSWGRVEMPWRFWHPDESKDPAAEAKAGRLQPQVRNAMEMAQRLYKKGIPVILSNWSAPDWAIMGIYTTQPKNGIWGNALNLDKTEKLYESIASYLIYMKDNYGVEIEAFSFNESDLGINIRQTPDEHRQLIKGLGAYLAAKGLKTKLLLGDTADVNGWAFTKAAIEDKETYPYISAVSFHSWRGYTDENLSRWAAIAKQVNKPLLVGEGSIDAGAWRYPAIFEEPTYALDEINLYVKMLSVCQPLSILQWQLTADYSPMSGGGVFGNTSTPLHPTQRFWNLKQLGSSPVKTFAMPVTCTKPDVTCAAVGDNAKGAYAIHLVNNGAKRNVVLTGLPDSVHELHIYTTNNKQEMSEGKPVIVSKGQARFTLEAAGFTSLINGQ